MRIRQTSARATAMAGAMLALACAGDAPEPPPESPPAGVYGQAPAAVGGIPSFVTLDGDGVPAPAGAATPGAASTAAATASPELDQFGLAFSPRALVVRVGEPLVVTNSEQLSHNVTIRLAENDSTVVNTDTDGGESFELRFDRPGGYFVSCSVHPGMTAFIYVTPAPYATVAEPDGRFLLTDVPPGTYTLSVWSTDAALRSTREVEVAAGPTEVDVRAPG